MPKTSGFFKKWVDLRHKYIYEIKSLRELAEEYEGQISLTAIGDKSVKEGWPELRLKYWAELGQDLDEKIKKKVIDAKENILNAGIYLFGKGITQLRNSIEKAEKEGKQINYKDAMEFVKMGIDIIYKFIEQKNDIDVKFSSRKTENKIENILMSIYGEQTEQSQIK